MSSNQNDIFVISETFPDWKTYKFDDGRYVAFYKHNASAKNTPHPPTSLLGTAGTWKIEGSGEGQWIFTLNK